MQWNWGTVEEAAAIRKVSPRTIRRMIAAGYIEAERFGPRLLRVNLDSVLRAGQPVVPAGGSSR